jgi:signal transduction histidine kinase
VPLSSPREVPAGERSTSAAPEPAVPAGQISILIVDDDPRNLAVLETILDEPGYRLVRAESADEALLALLEGDFALLILDVRLPGMTGFELARLIKERKKTARVPIIFLTAYYNEDQHVLSGYDMGAVDYLLKPVNPAILRSKVAVFAELHRMSRQLVTANRALLDEVGVRRRAEEMLRSLTNRVVQVQEGERRRVAVELHDNITQSLCAVLFRGQALAAGLAARDPVAEREAKQLLLLLKETAGEVERIAQSLRPSVLDQLGLLAVLRDAHEEFAARTGLSVEFSCVELSERLPAKIELALYRILQEALRNIEQHACAHNVAVTLAWEDGCIRLTIDDDGIGFDPEAHRPTEHGASGLGLLSMQERAINACGTLEVKSARASGTQIDVRIPLPLVSV